MTRSTQSSLYSKKEKEEAKTTPRRRMIKRGGSYSKGHNQYILNMLKSIDSESTKESDSNDLKPRFSLKLVKT